METEKKLIAQFLRERAGAFVRICLFGGIFLGLFALYHVPWRAAAYPAALCLCLEALFLLRDYRRFRREHEALRQLAELEELTPDRLPEPENQQARDYTRLLEGQMDRLSGLRTEDARRMTTQTDYFSAWAHQIKTPIASMGLKLQREDSALSRRLRGDLNRIEQYVDMAMTYLRLDAETGDYVFRQQPLEPIVRGAVKKFAGEFIDRKLGLRLEPMENTVLTDEKWLSFVIGQILSNALKYTPAGEISIYTREPDTLVIRDTGIGIAPEDLPRIFEKGFTGYNGRSDKKASGIGLYLCKRVCDRLGHEISIESEPGKGTAVYLKLGRPKIGIE